jgi:hypothetical protein
MSDMAELDTETAELVTETEEQVETPGTPETEAEGDLIVTIGEDAPRPEDDETSAPEWVRNLRKENRELKRAIKAAQAPVMQEAPKLGPKPTLESAEYDEARYDAELIAWNTQKAKVEAAAEEAKAEQEAGQKAWQDRIGAYQERKVALKAPDFDDVEDTVREALSVTQQGVIVSGANDPALMVYALGKNPAKLKELSSIKDPVKFAFAVARLEGELKVQTRKPATTPERTLTPSGKPSGGVDQKLEQLRAKAETSGDYTEYFAYKRAASKPK